MNWIKINKIISYQDYGTLYDHKLQTIHLILYTLGTL
jgi:hypothetical protein